MEIDHWESAIQRVKAMYRNDLPSSCERVPQLCGFRLDCEADLNVWSLLNAFLKKLPNIHPSIKADHFRLVAMIILYTRKLQAIRRSVNANDKVTPYLDWAEILKYLGQSTDVIFGYFAEEWGILMRTEGAELKETFFGTYTVLHPTEEHFVFGDAMQMQLIRTGIIEAPLFLSHAIDSMWDGSEVLNDILEEGADSLISAEMPPTPQQMQDFPVFRSQNRREVPGIDLVDETFDRLIESKRPVPSSTPPQPPSSQRPRLSASPLPGPSNQSVPTPPQQTSEKGHVMKRGGKTTYLSTLSKNQMHVRGEDFNSNTPQPPQLPRQKVPEPHEYQKHLSIFSNNEPMTRVDKITVVKRADGSLGFRIYPFPTTTRITGAQNTDQHPQPVDQNRFRVPPAAVQQPCPINRDPNSGPFDHPLPTSTSRVQAQTPHRPLNYGVNVPNSFNTLGHMGVATAQTPIRPHYVVNQPQEPSQRPTATRRSADQKLVQGEKTEGKGPSTKQ